MKIFVTSDHAGYELKNSVVSHLKEQDYDVEDLGPNDFDPEDDYPQFAYRATTKLLGSEDKNPRAILVCGGGQGMAIAANRVRGIRASVVWNEEEAVATRKDNDSNALALPARMIEEEKALKIVDTWLKEPFSGAPRHIRRLREIEEYYG